VNGRNTTNQNILDTNSQNISQNILDTNSQNIFEQQLARNTVFLNKDIISPHHVPSNLPFRKKQIEEVTQCLSPVLSNAKPNNFFIYGKPGTGKTSTVKHVLNQLEEFVKKNEKPVYSCYVNCRSHPSKYKVLLKALKKFYPEKDFLGYSSSFVYEKLLDFSNENKAHNILVLDELDKVKDVDELMYSLSRGNDELDAGSITVIGISNNLTFKEKLDPRTKSSLCEREMIFNPYNATELKQILSERSEKAFKEGVVKEEALSLASALAAQESGDARTAVMLMQRAGELADASSLEIIDDNLVEKAKVSVEEEIIISMISTLPEQEQLVLYAISQLSLSDKSGFTKVNGEVEKGVLFSGEIFEAYIDIAKKFGSRTITSRWYRQYINELEMYGLILVTNSGKGIKGQTRLIKLGFDASKIKHVLEKELFKTA
jgi:archaeal cell division control protein 6